MCTVEHVVTVNLPCRKDFRELYPQYYNYIRGEGAKLFDLVMTPYTFVKCKVVTDLGLPAITGVANDFVELCGKDASSYDKQTLGALVSTLMVYNNYEKAGKKRSISHKSFSKGEVYQKIKEQ